MPLRPLQPNPACPLCRCKDTVKKGKRRNRLRTLQVFKCPECLHRFTGEAGKNRTSLLPSHLWHFLLASSVAVAGELGQQPGCHGRWVELIRLE